MFQKDHIQIGISSCLLGEAVRHNGGHKRDRYITEVLSSHFSFVPFCPEVAIGLGVPRPTIRLQGGNESPRAIMPNAGSRDVTDNLDNYGREVAQSHGFISGYIFKSKSPSCGMERVKIYNDRGNLAGTGTGIYARTLIEELPLLPVEEEGRLNDSGLRDNFIERVFAYHRWQCMALEGITPAALIAFHTEHKFLLMAHNQQAMRRLGRMVARIKEDPEKIPEEYLNMFMDTMKKPATRKNRTNVLQHIAGYFKDLLDAADRQELAESIEAYRKDEIPIIVPLTLVRHHLRKNPDIYLGEQFFLKKKV